MMNVKKWSLLVAMVGVLLATAFANDGNETAKNRADVWKERRAHFTENVKPKIDAQRKKLETSLNEDDKTEIATLRKEIRKQRLLENEFMSEVRASHIKGEEVSEDLYEELKTQRIVIENLYDNVKIIANKYRPEIDDLVSDLKAELKSEFQVPNGNRQDFRRGQRNQGNMQSGPGMRNQHGMGMGQGPGFGHGPQGKFGYGPHGKSNRRSPGRLDIVTFLLWDANRG